MQIRAISFSILFLSAAVHAQGSCESWSDGLDRPGQSPSVQALGVFDDGTGAALYVGGPGPISRFGHLSGPGIARWDGTTWSVPGTNLVVAYPQQFLVFDDGNGAALYAAGRFQLSGSPAVLPVVRWDGASWSAVGASPLISDFSRGWGLAVFDDGLGPALYVSTAGGGVTSPDNNVWKWDGSAWTALSSGTDNGVYCLAVFDDGAGPRLIAGGSYGPIEGVTANGIAAWDGTSWSALGSGFGPPNYFEIKALAVHDDGSGPLLYAGGYFAIAGGGAAHDVARWNGSAWSPVGSGAATVVQELASVDLGGGPRLYAGGYAVQGAPSYFLQWDGSTWSEVGGDVNGDVYGLSVFDDGSGPALFAGGVFTQAAGLASVSLARWNGVRFAAVGMDTAGTDGSIRVLRTLDLGSGPALYAGGNFTISGDAATNGIARWNGTTWEPLGSGVRVTGSDGGTVEALAAFDDGGGTELYAAGTFTAAGTQPVNRIARFDGSSWLPVDNGVDSEVRALEVFDDGGGPALYAGGTFLHAGGMPASFIARWDGASWSAVGAGLSNWVYALAVFDDGTGKALYAAGRAIGVRRWRDSTWTQVGGQNVVYALHVWDDGNAPHLYAGGIFSAVGGNNVARLDGGTWTSLGSGTDALVTAFAHLDDAAGPGLFATGYFTIAGGVSADRVARWNGTAWSALGDTFTGTDWNAIAAFDAGSSGGPDVYVGGEFTRIGARWSSNVARWVPCAAPGSPFCFGDGSGAACPCVNFGLPGRGCENSSSTGGARLRAIGSVAADTVVLEVTGERPSVLSVFLQGTSSIAPHLFGDGLRCTGGTLKRLYSKSAVGGAVSAPGPGDPSIRARSAALGDPIPAGALRAYQTYYRDAFAGFCPPPRGNLWNVTNAVQVRW